MKRIKRALRAILLSATIGLVGCGSLDSKVNLNPDLNGDGRPDKIWAEHGDNHWWFPEDYKVFREINLGGSKYSEPT